jgi:hypothetical protein
VSAATGCLYILAFFVIASAFAWWTGVRMFGSTRDDR